MASVESRLSPSCPQPVALLVSLFLVYSCSLGSFPKITYLHLNLCLKLCFSVESRLMHIHTHMKRQAHTLKCLQKAKKTQQMVLLTILSARNSFIHLHCFLLIFRCTSIALIVFQEKTPLRTPLKNSPPDPEKDSLSNQAQSFGVIKQEKSNRRRRPRTRIEGYVQLEP